MSDGGVSAPVEGPGASRTARTDELRATGGPHLGDPGTSVVLAADRAAILDPGTPAFQDLPRLPEELR